MVFCTGGGFKCNFRDLFLFSEQTVSGIGLSFRNPFFPFKQTWVFKGHGTEGGNGLSRFARRCDHVFGTIFQIIHVNVVGFHSFDVIAFVGVPYAERGWVGKGEGKV